MIKSKSKIPQFFYIIVEILALLFCLLEVSKSAYSEETKPNQKLFTAAVFGADGRLWRVVPTR